MPRQDIRVLPVWEKGITGSGVLYGIIGNGCYLDHLDLKDQNIADLNINFDNPDAPDQEVQPYPGDQNKEKTSTMAAITLASSNDICISGIVPNASYYCIKQTSALDENKIAAALSQSNSVTHVKLLTIPHTCSNIFGTPFARCYAPKKSLVIEEALKSNSKTIFVSPVGDDALSGIDANTFPDVKNPNVISVADITPKGERAFWSNRGTCIVVNAPSGGHFAPFGEDKYAPYPPSISLDGIDKCHGDIHVNGVNPIGTGAAVVAGVVGLMLESRFDLSWRDVQAIFAVTSQRNDPFHSSWKTNSARVKYSDIYGFGRVDANAAINLSSSWIPFKTQVHDEVSFTDMHIQYSRSGFHEVKAQKVTQIEFIEYVALEFNFKKVSILRLDLVSPTGTVAHVVTPSSCEDSTGTLFYVIRNFFGENAKNGEWKIRISIEGYCIDSIIENINLKIYGLDYNPNLDIKENALLQSSPAQQNIIDPSDLRMEVRPSSVQCGSDFTMTLYASPQYSSHKYSIYLKDSLLSTLYQIDSDVRPSTEMTYSIPCIVKNTTYKLYAENRRHEAYTEQALTLVNKMPESISSPSPYQVIPITSGNNVKMELSISSFSDFLSSDSSSQSALVSIIDIDTSQSVFSMPVIIKAKIPITFSLAHNISHALLSVIPLWNSQYSGCNTLIQPLSFMNEVEDNIPPFPIRISNKCPLPPGVLVIQPTPEITSSQTIEQTQFPTEKQNEKPETKGSPGYVFATIIFVVVIVAISFWYISRRNQYTQGYGVELLGTDTMI